MGETPDRIGNGMEFTEARVQQLRQQIASKRQELGTELAELKRRRREAVVRGKRLAAAAGIGAVGMVLLGSLTSAIADLFADDHDHSDDNSFRHNERQRSSGSALPGLLGFGLIGARWIAKEYIEFKLRERQERNRQQAYSHRNGNLSS